jgi:hypothetical protein
MKKLTGSEEINYGLENLIRNVEELPVYLEVKDLQKNSFWKPLRRVVERKFHGNLLSDVFSHLMLMPKVEEAWYEGCDSRYLNLKEEKLSWGWLNHRFNLYKIQGKIELNEKIAQDKIQQINKVFDPILKKIKRDYEWEKEPEKAAKLFAEYQRMQASKVELQKRVEKWLALGWVVLYAQHNIPARQLLTELTNVNKIYYFQHHNQESIRQVIKELSELEKPYEKYNGGRGLKALEEIKGEINHWLQVRGVAPVEFSGFKEISGENRESMQERLEQIVLQIGVKLTLT